VQENDESSASSQAAIYAEKEKVENFDVEGSTPVLTLQENEGANPKLEPHSAKTSSAEVRKTAKRDFKDVSVTGDEIHPGKRLKVTDAGVSSEESPKPRKQAKHLSK